MTNNLEILQDITKNKEDISFADGGSVTATYKGTYRGYIYNNKITLKNVLYVPSFKRSLISIDCLTDKNYKTIFFKKDDKNMVSIYNNKRNRLCTISSNNNKVYKLWTSLNKMFFNDMPSCDSLTKVDDNMELWHRRLGHFNIDNLKEDLNKLPVDYRCKICASSKLKNKPYPMSENKTKAPFELVHMDTVSSPDTSIYGNKYFLTILDDYTRYGWVIFIKSKGDVFDAFSTWHKRIKNIFNTNIKYIRTDNGTEFQNNDFKKLCKEEGIIHQFTIPYNPQQNGRAERLNGILIHNATAMLQEAKLNHKFWEDAVRTANYIHNRIPHSGIENKVPFELLYNEKVDYSKFKVFGCQAFYLVPKHLHKKFTDTTLPGTFIGYDEDNHTAYRIFDYNNNKVVLSRAVSFFEDTPSNISAPSTTPETIDLHQIYELGGNPPDKNVNGDTYYNSENILNSQRPLGEGVINQSQNFSNINNNFSNQQNYLNYNNQNYNNLNYRNPYNTFQPYQYPLNFNYYNENFNLNPHIQNPPFTSNSQFINPYNLNYDYFYIPNGKYNYLYNFNNLNNNIHNLENRPIKSNHKNLNNLNHENLNFKSNDHNFDQNVNNEINGNLNTHEQEYATENQINNNNNIKNSINGANNINSQEIKENVEIKNENLNKKPIKIKINAPRNKINKTHNTNKGKPINKTPENNKVNDIIENDQNLDSQNDKIESTNLNLNDTIAPNKMLISDVNKNNSEMNKDTSVDLNTEGINDKNKDIEIENKITEINDNSNGIGNDVIIYENTNKNNKTVRRSTRISNKKINKRKRKNKRGEDDEDEDDDDDTKRIKVLSVEKTHKIMANLAENTLIEPTTYKSIFSKSDKNEWIKAVKDELNNMKELNVYTIVNTVPKNANVITPKWVFKYKHDANGKISKRKARLVARGYSQKYGIDFTATFSPTLKQDSLRLITSIAAQNNYNIYQIDVKAAYLNAELEEDIYMRIPEGDSNYQNGYWKLNKALYGLKQAGRMWNITLDRTLRKMNFERLKSEPCLYIKRNKDGKVICMLAVYVDDILITGIESDTLNTRNMLKEKFKITDTGFANFIIGIKIEKLKDGYLLHQKRYLDELLKKFNIDKYKPVSNIMPIENEYLRKKKFDQTKYRKAVGSLLYLAICTRPDIMFAVSKASRNLQDPNYEDWFNVIKIFRYLKGNQSYGIKFSNNKELQVYVDADFGGDNKTRRSTTGFVMLMGNGPTSWYSKIQHCVSTSTAESEYYALDECARHCLWYRNVLGELSMKRNCITINTDNKAAIYNCENETINPRSKHIDIKFHHIRELIKQRKIKLNYIKSEFNLADGFTKYLNGTLMNNFRNNILEKF